MDVRTYGRLQVWARPHPSQLTVTVHFKSATTDEIELALTAAAADKLIDDLRASLETVLRAAEKAGVEA